VIIIPITVLVGEKRSPFQKGEWVLWVRFQRRHDFIPELGNRRKELKWIRAEGAIENLIYFFVA
jgi:hypothetical protein